MSLCRLLLFLALVVTAASAAPPTPVDLLLVAADDATLQPLIQRLAQPHTETRAAWTFWLGQLSGKSVVLTRSEGDPLNAVAATTLAIRLHPPRLIFCYGVARAHDPALSAGDIIVSESFAAFDGIVSPITEVGGGSDALTWHRLPHALMTPDEKENYILTFPADSAAAELALKLRVARGHITRGVLGSANQINREADRIAYLRHEWHTSTEDGESAHVAGCAALFGVPVVGVRIVDGAPAEAAAFALDFVEAWK